MDLKKYIIASLTVCVSTFNTVIAQNAEGAHKDTIRNKNISITNKTEGLNKLNDNPKAKKYDEKWLQELSNSDLFFQMSEDVAAVPTDVDYNELPTEVLKERLEKLNEKTPFNIEYLAIIESALNPKARSRAGATGLWQFMYATGRSYGLEVNNYVDERCDPLRATKAAVRYLNELYKIFGDWDLVLAAYNSGPGNVTKAMRRSNGKTNYWNLRPYLPKETAGYVPAFLATLYIFEYAKEHGFKPQKRTNHLFETDTIRVKQAIPFKSIADITGMSIQDIQFFNPSYQLDVVPYVEGRNYALRLPISEVGKFVANEETIYAYLNEEKAKREKPLPEVLTGDQYKSSSKKITYTVKKSDNLGKIATRYGVSVSSIKRWNRIKGKSVRVGQRLVIYK